MVKTWNVSPCSPKELAAPARCQTSPRSSESSAGRRSVPLQRGASSVGRFQSAEGSENVFFFFFSWVFFYGFLSVLHGF